MKTELCSKCGMTKLATAGKWSKDGAFVCSTCFLKLNRNHAARNDEDVDLDEGDGGQDLDNFDKDDETDDILKEMDSDAEDRARDDEEGWPDKD